MVLMEEWDGPENNDPVCENQGTTEGGTERGQMLQRKQKSGTALHRRCQHHSQPVRGRSPGLGHAQGIYILMFSTPLLTVQNFMKYCSTVAAMNKQYTSE